MSATASPQLRMAGDIAVQFRHVPDDEAASAVAAHIRSFWEPRMRAELLRLVEEDPGAADPLVVAAARILGEG